MRNNTTPVPENERKIMIYWIAGMVILVLVFAGTFAFRMLSHPMGPGGFNMPVAVKTLQVHQGPLDWNYVARGTVEANNIVDLKPETAGKVVSLNFEEGQSVNRGTMLIRLKADKQMAQVQQAAASMGSMQQNVAVKETEIERLQADVRAAMAQKKFADIELERFDKLYKGEFVSAEERDQKRTAAEVAQTTYDAALKRVSMARAERKQAFSQLSAAASDYSYNRAVASDTLITAPFSGMVGQKYVFLGDYVQPGQKLVTLVDNRMLKIHFDVPERYLGYIHLNQPLTVTVESLPGKTFKAETIFVDPAVDSASRMVAVKARLLEGVEHFKPGQFAEVKLALENKTNALTVPEEAVVPQGEKTFVYVARGGKAFLQEIRTGQREPGFVEVLSGLKPTDRVVVGGIQKLTDGKEIMEGGAKPGPQKSGPAKKEGR